MDLDAAVRPPPHLLAGLDPDRFPPDPVERNSGGPSSGASGSFSLISSVPKLLSGGGGPACSHTIYGPEEVPDNFHRNLKQGDFRQVLDKIQISYRKVELDSESLESGYGCCLGLLNPIANIRVNNSIFNSCGLLNPKANSRVNSSASSSGKGGDMFQRSLDGLVTFLTCLFPYLPVAEALAYLNAVNADPLAAAALIIARRGRNYCLNYSLMDPATAVTTMEMALKCGAMAAKHPDPALLVKGWKSLSPYLHQVDRDLSAPHPDCNTVGFLHRNVRNEDDNLDVQAVWELADGRLREWLGKSSRGGLLIRLPPVRAAMKRMLLAKIHGFYLKALCIIPHDELTERYHRALVMGGYCYGPLKPAVNIVVNMIWYEQTFPIPKTKRRETHMIGTELLWQVAARSLYGLISFMCTRYPSLTPDQAMQRLLVADANLQVADPNLFDTPSNLEMDWSSCPQIGSGKDTVPIQMQAVRKASASVLEAYTAAATAACHPSPAAQKEFLGSPDSVQQIKCAADMIELDDGHPLPNNDFEWLCASLNTCRYSLTGVHREQEPEPTAVGNSDYTELSRRKDRFVGLHNRATRMVSAALRKLSRTDGSQYNLHIICGVNELVSGPKFCSPMGRVLPSFPFKYQYSHINFVATCFDKKQNAVSRRLFFAQCNLDDGNDAWCVPVDWAHPIGGGTRCFYCETHGNRIIHPSIPDFHGFDFGDAFFGDYKNFYDNDQIIFLKATCVDWVDGVEEEAIYHNYRLRDDDGNIGSMHLLCDDEMATMVMGTPRVTT